MNTFTVPQVKDFMVCELFYKYRYLDKEHESISGREQMTRRFESTLKRVASFFFYKKQGGITPSYNSLLNRWEKLWFPKDMTAYDLAVEQHEVVHGNLASLSNSAAITLMQFHEDFAGDKADPVLIDEKFLVPMGKDTRLEGTIDLVTRLGDEYKLYKWAVRQKRPALGSLTLDFAAQRLAFEFRNEVKKKVSYTLYDIGSARPGSIAVDPSESDVRALRFWADEAASTKIFVPRRGLTSYCRGCVFDKPCSNFAITSKMLAIYQGEISDT